MLKQRFIKIFFTLIFAALFSTCGRNNQFSKVRFKIDTSSLMASSISINGVQIFGLHLDTGDRFSFNVPEIVQDIDLEYPHPLPPGNWEFRFMAYENMDSTFGRAQIWCEKFTLFLSGVMTVNGVLERSKCKNPLFAGAFLSPGYMAYDEDDDRFRELRVMVCNNAEFTSYATAYGNTCLTAANGGVASFKVVIPSYPLVRADISLSELLQLSNSVSPPIHSDCMGDAIGGSNFDGNTLVDNVQVPIPPPGSSDFYAFLYVYKNQTNCTGVAHVYHWFA